MLYTFHPGAPESPSLRITSFRYVVLWATISSMELRETFHAGMLHIPPVTVLDIDPIDLINEPQCDLAVAELCISPVRKIIFVYCS